MKKLISNGELFELAKKARERAYAPYSNITVGAALVTRSGRIYTGANIENAAFSPSVCAERVAFFTALHNGEREFSAIAVAGGENGCEERRQFTPCGVCRQVMAEFAGNDFKIVLGEDESLTLGELLPYGFNKDKIK